MYMKRFSLSSNVKQFYQWLLLACGGNKETGGKEGDQKTPQGNWGRHQLKDKDRWQLFQKLDAKQPTWRARMECYTNQLIGRKINA